MKRPPDGAPERERGESFVSRWSRRKEEVRQAPSPARQEADPASPAPELPPVDQLTPDSDFRPFFHPKVDEDVRRAALKKLFSDPHFNVMDGLDVYIDDYSKSEPIPPAMLAGLRQAQNILAWAKEDEEKRAKEKPPRTIEPPAAQPTPGPEARTVAQDGAPASPSGPGGQAKA